jgi:tripartite-type tricarboxylate transporter receptor subunit TctC
MQSKSTTLKRLALMAGFLTLASAATLPSRVLAQEYPSKPIRFVVASTAGGVVDIRARRFGLRIGELLKQPVIVDNKPGATTTIGADFVAKAAPDGYTALFGGNTEVVYAPALGVPTKYDPVADLIPVAQFSQGFPVFVINAALGPKNLNELIVWAKANPGKLLCGTSGHGSSAHFMCELLARSAKIEVRSVPYKSTGAMLLDTASGQVHIAIGYTAEVDKQYIQTGKVIPFGTLGPRRIPVFPNVPTMAELGYPNFELLSWTGLFVPGKTPKDIIDKLHATITKVVREPEFVKWLGDTGSEVVTPSPAEFARFTRGELERWRKMSADMGIKLE